MPRVLLLILFTLTISSPLCAADWPQFRGPDGQGHSSEQDLPLEWSEDKNVVWKVPIPGLGWSSPVIQGDRIWLTTALGQGRSLRAICLHRKDGRILNEVEIFLKENPGRIHSKNSHASPTPILEDDRVYVHFGAHGTACVSNDGQVLWRRELKYEHLHGPGGSPVLFGDLLIVSCDGSDVQYVVGLDKHTGQIRWKQSRGKGGIAYSTPLVIQAEGIDQVVSTGADRVISYDPLTGKELWWFPYDAFSLVPRPVHGLGLIFVCGGFNSPTLYALRPTGRGDLSWSHLEWSLSKGVPFNPSPVLVGEYLYLVSDTGVASCLDARTGKILWKERLKGNFSASPLAAPERIYFLNEEGETTVLAPGKEFKKLSTNPLAGRTLASLAVADKAIYLRNAQFLYRIEDVAEKPR